MKVIKFCYACISKLNSVLKNNFWKIKLLKFAKSWQNITTKIQKQVLLNQQYISGNWRKYFDNNRENDIIDDYINSCCQYCQKNRQLVIYQNVNYGIGILIIEKVPLCHHHINLGRNILAKLVPKTCQHI